ncbi:hypothetical protein FIBSPDRAFT_873199, partial [Athelia psychrophila]
MNTAGISGHAHVTNIGRDSITSPAPSDHAHPPAARSRPPQRPSSTGSSCPGSSATSRQFRCLSWWCWLSCAYSAFDSGAAASLARGCPSAGEASVWGVSANRPLDNRYLSCGVGWCAG